MYAMEKRSALRVGRDSRSGRFIDRDRVLGTTRDGVAILKPKGGATHFTDKELWKAIDSARLGGGTRVTSGRDPLPPRKG